MDIRKLCIIADSCELTSLGIGFIVSSQLPEATIARPSDKAQLIALLERNRQALVVIDYARFGLRNADELHNLAARFSSAAWVEISDELAQASLLKLAADPLISLCFKHDSAYDIGNVVSQAVGGTAAHSPAIESAIVDARQRSERTPLTQVETEVLTMIAHGMTAKEIAAARSASIHTIITHKKNIFRKIQVNTAYEATQYALKSGLANPVEYYI